MTAPKKPRRFAIEQLDAAALHDRGFCLACGEEHEGPIEPDARKEHCPSCGAMEVCGAEHIAIMGLIK